MDVSIIIVNYNTYDLTAACIQSIIEHTKRISYEIIVVDNASTDGSKEKFERDSRIKYIYSEKNGGFGYGNNRGIEIANGDYFFLLNSDTLLLNNAIYEFFKYAKSHKSRIIYGCYLQGNDGTYRNSFFYFPAFTIKEFFRRMIFPHNYEQIILIKKLIVLVVLVCLSHDLQLMKLEYLMRIYFSMAKKANCNIA